MMHNKSINLNAVYNAAGDRALDPGLKRMITQKQGALRSMAGDSFAMSGRSIT